MDWTRAILLVCLLFHVTSHAEMTERELNAPVEDAAAKTMAEPIGPSATPPNTRVYFFPAYSTQFGIKKDLWVKAQTYYDTYWKTFNNRRYVALVNLGLPYDQKRFHVLDLETGQVKSYLTAHGVGSDPTKVGVARYFSNEINSRKSSLGAYETMHTYMGKNGRSLYLNGLESTNNNALSRAIVIHGADYIKEKSGKSGWSWGCPALDHAVAQSVIDQLQGGALLMIDSVK